jgi:hypothetical protein
MKELREKEKRMREAGMPEAQVEAVVDYINSASGTLSATKDDLNAVELRLIDRMDQRFDAINQRFDALNESFNQRIDSLNKSLNKRIDALDTRLWTAMGTMTAIIILAMGVMRFFG